MALRAAALALLAGAANAQDDTRPIAGVPEAARCTPFEGGGRPCADGLICHDHWDNVNAVWEGSFTCYPEDTVFTMAMIDGVVIDPDTPRCADVGGDPMMACAPTFWCNADGACESVLRDGHTPSDEEEGPPEW